MKENVVEKQFRVFIHMKFFVQFSHKTFLGVRQVNQWSQMFEFEF